MPTSSIEKLGSKTDVWGLTTRQNICWEVHKNFPKKSQNTEELEEEMYLISDKKMGDFGEVSLDKMGGVFDLNQKGSKLRYNSFLTHKHMNVFA